MPYTSSLVLAAQEPTPSADATVVISAEADIAAATGNGIGNDGFFGGSGWWIILLFLFAWGGWGNGGWGGNSNAGATTIYGLDNLASTRDGFYDLNTGLLNGFASTVAAVNAGTSAIQSDICNMGMQNL